MHYLYKIMNINNNKNYIGQSNDHLYRWSQHKYYATKPEITKQYIHYAMNEHGIESFTHEIIAVCMTPDDANYLEEQLIIQYNSLAPNGYNLTTGGKKYIPTPETRAKISIAQKGIPKRKLTEDEKQHLREINTGKKQSPETIEKRAAKLRGRKITGKKPLTKEHKSNLSKTKLNGKITDEDIPIIKHEYSIGKSMREIGRKYNVSHHTISKIIRHHRAP